jgi:flagellin
MTRINTNTSSLIAQNHLRQNTVDLQQALTRLSTGLRINVGKDDPAGLIASEALRSDITSIETAITNTERANQMIATADGALGLVSDLLNDIRGLVVEAANTGALSDDQISANQLQVDSSLEAINRIAQTTTFQGRRLLDGSLDFANNLNLVDSVIDFQIDQVNFGASGGTVAVDVDIASPATQAVITNSGGFTAAATATTDVNLGYTLSIAEGGGDFLRVAAQDVNDDISGINILFNDNDGALGVTYADGDSTIQINGNWDDAGFQGATSLQDIIDVLEGNADFLARFAASATNGAATLSGDLTGDAGNFAAIALQIDAEATGAEYNGVKVNVTSGAANAATYDADQKVLDITIANTAQTVESLASALDTLLDGDFAVSRSGGTANDAIAASSTTVTQTVNTNNTGGNVLNDSLVVSIGGSGGREVFSFQGGASVNQIASGINLISDATGVSASFSGGTLTLTSGDYGSNATVDVDVIDEGSSGTFATSLSANQASGTDINATINGISASSTGNTFGINTATLDLSLTVANGSDTNFEFDITGGGALFQMGPDVVSNQQAVLGIPTLNTAKLGGASGRLHELASGGSKSLANAPNQAFPVVDEVINKITTLRGRLGSFQRTSLETNITSLNETLVNLTAAESSIRDADFAKETAALTRAQILVQSGTRVLTIANSNPQSVLSLLQ